MKKVMVHAMQWLAACMLLGGISCKKNGGRDLPPPVSPFKVITTGYVYNAGNALYEPYYWINEQRHPLEMGMAKQAFPYGMEKAGADLYVAGGYSNDGMALLPCYWKNGQRKDLPTDALTIGFRCCARDAKWLNNALYILGDVDLRPVIWKVTANDVTTLEINGGPDMTVAMNLEVYNGQLYFASTKFVPTLPGNDKNEAGYWIFNTDNTYQYHPLESNLRYALCFALAVSDKGVFITGERADTTMADAKPAVWSSNGLLSFVNQINPDKQQLNEVVADSKGKLYFNVVDIAAFKPVVWKVNGAAYEPLKPAVPAAAYGRCDNLAIIDDQLAYAFSYKDGNLYYAGYSFNGTQTLFQTDSSQWIGINRTGLFLE